MTPKTNNNQSHQSGAAGAAGRSPQSQPPLRQHRHSGRGGCGALLAMSASDAGRAPDRPALRRVRGLACARAASSASRSRHIEFNGRGQPRPRSFSPPEALIASSSGAAVQAGHFFLRDRGDRAKSDAADRKPRAGQQPDRLMLAAYVPNGHSLERRDIVSGEEIPENAVWLDLVNPGPGEDKVVERLVGIAVPTREEMQEIEVSSRLYVEHHARYMTATLMCNSDTAVPKTTAVTFILVRPSPGHRALRRPAAVHDRRQQARPELPGQRHRRERAARTARRRDRPRRRHPGAHRHGGRPRLARHLRARRRGRSSRCPTRTS